MDNMKIIMCIREIAEGKTPANDISSLLWSHKCYYLLSLLPNLHNAEKLQQQMIINEHILLSRLKICKDFLVEIDFPYAMIKGATLSYRAYQNISMRLSSDIDLLISKNDAHKCKTLLEKHGFYQGYIKNKTLVPYTREEILFYELFTHQMPPFLKISDKGIISITNIDVNTDIYWKEKGGNETDLSFILNNREILTYIGNTPIVSLSPEMDFICLCLHHYKDLNSIFLLCTRDIKVSVFCDIFFYLKNNQIEPSKLKYFSDVLNAGRYVYYCLFYCNKIFDNELIHFYLSLFDADRDESLYETYGLGNNRYHWTIQFEDRIFQTGLKDFILPQLNKTEIQNLRINKKYMH